MGWNSPCRNECCVWKCKLHTADSWRLQLLWIYLQFIERYQFKPSDILAGFDHWYERDRRFFGPKNLKPDHWNNLANEWLQHACGNHVPFLTDEVLPFELCKDSDVYVVVSGWKTTLALVVNPLCLSHSIACKSSIVRWYYALFPIFPFRLDYYLDLDRYVITVL